MQRIHLRTSTARLAVLAVCVAAALYMPAARAAALAKSGIAWHVASSDAEVDKAFAAARQSGRPVFLYWGAVWCPPCNQVKATLFSRPDFVERSRAFVPVYVDGDKPGAQKVAARFKVSGYPTMILFKPDGSEITRLPGEVDPQRYLLTLTSALQAQAPVKELVRRGLAKQQLAPEQWRLLAFYSWDTDEQQVVSAADLARSLSELAAAAPASLQGVKDRLAFKAVLARARMEKAPDAAAVEADRRTVERILADAGAPEELADLVLYYAEPVLKYVAPDAKVRAGLATKWEEALDRVLAAHTPTKATLIDALDSRVSLWKFGESAKELGAQRRDRVLREVARIVAATTDRYERQAVVPSAAHVLTAAGLGDDSDKLLKAELPRAVAPYYHMLGLAGNAKKRGDAKAALQWYELAWRKSEGPATRIQWGTNYVGNILLLAPTDVARVSSAAGALLSGLEVRNETFFERNQRSLQRMAKKLAEWQAGDPARVKVVDGLKAQLARTCSKLPARDPGRVNCETVFSGAAVAS